MKTTLPSRHSGARAFGRLLGAMFGVWMLGAAYTPAVAATAPEPWMGAAPEPAPAAASTSAPASSSTVMVDQQPLTVQPTIPPNIVLMLDDSGSMGADYMPDFSYLKNNSDNDALIDASNNGVYYNPTVVYSPPPLANSTSSNPQSNTSYSDMGNVPHDGFATSLSYVNLFTYDGSYECDDSQNCGSFSDEIFFNTSVENAKGSQQTYDQIVNSTTSGRSTIYADQVCKNTFNSHSTASNYSFTSKSSRNGNSLSGECKFTYNAFNFFQYSTGPVAGPYTVYYVAQNSGDCAYAPTPGNCVLASDTSGTAAPAKDASGNALKAGQNIANWFAYYHTRILMAKSGLMTAFSTVDKTFRVGFGSINGNNGSGITQVQPFGDGSSSSDQKTAFWKWVTGESANNTTPLRVALDKVGRYYQTSQPWTTLSTDPTYGTPNASTLIACRQAYAILTTDGFWNDSSVSSVVSGATGASGNKWVAETGPNNQSWPATANSKPAAPYSGGGLSSGPSLADVAMYYWENDLQSGISNEVPPSTDDPAFWQHMTTFTMGLGFTPQDSKGNAIDMTAVFNWANGGSPISNFSWPTPKSNSINNIADLAHAAVNGHGGFYSATSPQAFSSGLADALARAASRVGTGASLAANSTQLTSGTMAYQAQYVTSQWYGDLMALSIDSSTGAIASSCASTGSWCAATVLANSSSSGTYPNRAIMTYVPSTTWISGAGSFVAFKNSNSTTPPSLSTSQLSALGSSASAQANMVNYLRGDNTLEQSNGGGYRTRDKVLGDIVDSQPVYSGAPNPNEFEGESFTGISNSASSGDNSFNAFAVGTTDSSGTAKASAASTRAALVFVAANDGMLHAFNASNGSEQYAYLPGAVITAGLSNLANTGYGTTDTVPHQYYNDGELTIADVFFNSAWHTVLVGTTGRGTAKAVYALDITDPANITPLWERSAGDGGTNAGYIGQMVGKPVIAQVADGNWQVLIGNGYNSANGTAALLEFNVANGTLNVHTTDSTVANGLAAPVTWMDDASNGISMEAYAGDLRGRVWEFPLDTKTTSTTGTTTTTTYAADLATAGTKEFTADSGGTVQPITAGMLAGRDPATGNVWVFFGTGQYLSSSDLTNKQVQSWYGLIVQAGKNQPDLPALPTDTQSGVQSGDLVQRSITYEQDGDSTASPPTLGVRTVTTLPTPSDMSGKRGWYMDLEAPTGANGALVPQGERMVTPNQFQGNLLLGTTRIPEAAANSDICNSSGTGWVMAVDPFTGTNPGADFFQVNGGNDTVTLPGGQVVPVAGVGFTSLPNNPIFVGGDMLMSFDNGTTTNVNTSGASGVPQRVSWQELVNP